MNEIENIILHFANAVGHFSTAQLAIHLKSVKMNVPKATLYVNLSRLMEKKSLVRVSRGIYVSASAKPEFKANTTEDMRNLYSFLHEKLPFADFCLYAGTDLTQFQHNMAANNIIYIETQRDTCRAAFNVLKDAGKLIYLQPNRDMINQYINMAEPAVFVKSLTTESPVKKCDNGMAVPTLEKLMVDIHKDEDFFYLQGEETFYIFRNASERYCINGARLMRYAKRRNTETVFKKYMEWI